MDYTRFLFQNKEFRSLAGQILMSFQACYSPMDAESHTVSHRHASCASQRTNVWSSIVLRLGPAQSVGLQIFLGIVSNVSPCLYDFVMGLIVRSWVFLWVLWHLCKKRRLCLKFRSGHLESICIVTTQASNSEAVEWVPYMAPVFGACRSQWDGVEILRCPKSDQLLLVG